MLGPATALAQRAAVHHPLPRDTALLAARALTLPVQGVAREELVDTFGNARSQGRRHDAIDIMASAGTPVLAVEDGRIAKLFLSKPGGITIYQFDPGARYSYYYAHLQRYADGLREGQQVRRGQVIGYVGSTGNASPQAPHLHFAIARLPPDQAWWKGDSLNPYPVLRGS
ncbi:M23 family metallopeptidase [Pulveribacter suum]|uniref:M23 family metallopeptidase n=1 Tax=Pulveribacter suum TaxID=2116657 RepID=UPI001D055ED8|nr:M23 family metallopeptidase [Pulveribacter suum]